MPQIFRRSTNVLSRVSLAGAGVLIVGGLLVPYIAYDSPYFNHVGEARPQPVQFSHKHHVGDDGIDCRYCHTSVETSAFAGIPPLATCMTCHAELLNDAAVLAPLRRAYSAGETLAWNRVHDLPDFVYFDHSIHVAKG